MTNRIAALKALYESGIQDSSDASIEQSIATYQGDGTVSLDSDGSLDLQAPEADRPAALLSSSEDIRDTETPSASSTQQKIDQLTAERDDLKIEVDFHRRNMSPEDVGAEVISLRQEKLGYVRRLQKLNELVKGQDQALKTVNKQVKAWESKMQSYDELQDKLRAAEERARAAEAAAEAARTHEPDSTQVEELQAALRTQQLENEALERELTALNEANEHRKDDRDDRDDRDALIEDLRADLQDAEKEIEYLRTNPESAETDAMEQLQRQVDEQHETIASLQDALAAERLIVAEKDGELDRMDQVEQESHAAIAQLEEQLAVRTESEAAALEQAQHLDAENQRLDRELREAHTYHEGLANALKEKLSQSAVQLHESQQAFEALSVDVDELRSERDALLDSLDRNNAKRNELEDLNARLNEKLVQLVKDLKDEETARERADTNWTKRYNTTELQTQRILETKNELIESLERQLSQTRSDKQQLEKEQQKLQRALQSQDNKQLQRSEDQAIERQAVEAERARHEREAKRLAAELARVQEELAQKEDHFNDAEEQVHRLQTETKELASALQSEVRTRLGTQERFEMTQKALDDARTTLSTSRTRRSEPERTPVSRRGDAQQQAQLAERNHLLATVYESLTKALAGADSSAGVVVRGPLTQRKHAGDDGFSTEAKLVHHQLPLFTDHLMQLVRKLSHIQSMFEQRARALERGQSDQLASLRRQQESRLGQLERIERSIKAAAGKQAQWRKRIVDTEAEVSALQRANQALQQQLGRVRDASSTRAAPHGADSPARWSVRLRELEQRVKEADERVKRERLGAREARARDEAKIRHLQTLVERLETPPA
ncbi:hypothetical protein MOBT1_000895 [Malassezia obtusa]|uniref:Uncharacterized protein n=1 Tax=Malassezia obtusa TaxID=76774 RepID=A0AAF0DYA7_9BASI|nr:hypothetical protein MOBT1_000895 [Malassezia obtusa]